MGAEIEAIEIVGEQFPNNDTMYISCNSYVMLLLCTGCNVGGHMTERLAQLHHAVFQVVTLVLLTAVILFVINTIIIIIIILVALL